MSSQHQQHRSDKMALVKNRSPGSTCHYKQPMKGGAAVALLEAAETHTCAAADRFRCMLPAATSCKRLYRLVACTPNVENIFMPLYTPSCNKTIILKGNCYVTRDQCSKPYCNNRHFKVHAMLCCRTVSLALQKNSIPLRAQCSQASSISSTKRAGSNTTASKWEIACTWARTDSLSVCGSTTIQRTTACSTNYRTAAAARPSCCCSADHDCLLPAKTLQVELQSTLMAASTSCG